MKKVKFSIIGSGRIALRHAEHIIKQGELVAACDIDPHALKYFSSKFPKTQLYNSVEELLKHDKTSEVVNICSPSGLHARHTIAALRSGKHVVCEKPMALNGSDCRKMIKESLIAKKKLFIVKQNRYNSPVKKLKQIVDKGLLGKIFSAQLNCFWNRPDRYYNESVWKGTAELDGGILFTQFSHFIDLLYWLLGDVKNVKAFSENMNHRRTIEFDDTIIAIVKFSSGALVTMNFTINSFNKNMEGSITLFGEKGTVKAGGQYLNKLEYQDIKGYTIDSDKKVRLANNYGYYEGSMSNHDKVIANVIEVLQGKAKIAVDASEGMKTVEIIERIYQSAQPGNR